MSDIEQSGDRPKPRSRPSDYRTARIGAAASLTGVLVVMLLLDAFLDNYEVSPFVVVAILGCIAALVQVEFHFPWPPQ